MYQVYRQTLGNKPLLFGGGSPDTGGSEDLSGVDLSMAHAPATLNWWNWQNGRWAMWWQPYWSWYGFNSRVEWCACFVSWCYNQAGKSEPRFAGCEWRVFPGSSLMASGVRVVMIILLPVMRFSLTGIRMELPTMWGLSLVRMEAGSTLWREIPVMPAKSKVMI